MRLPSRTRVSRQPCVELMSVKFVSVCGAVSPQPAQRGASRLSAISFIRLVQEQSRGWPPLTTEEHVRANSALLQLDDSTSFAEFLRRRMRRMVRFFHQVRLIHRSAHTCPGRSALGAGDPVSAQSLSRSLETSDFTGSHVRDAPPNHRHFCRKIHRVGGKGRVSGQGNPP